MKKHFKKWQFLLIAVILALTGCVQDDVYFSNQKSESEITSRVITYQELKKMPKAIAMLEKLKKEKLKKSVYNPRYDFTVDTTQVLLIEIGTDYHSLTFTVSRDSTYAHSVENLILNWEPYQDYKTFFIEYTLTEEEELKIANGDYVDTKNKERLTILPEFSPSTILKSASGGNEDQVFLVNGKCYRGMWVRDESYTSIPGQLEKSKFIWVYVAIPCPEGYDDYSLTEGNHPRGGGGTYPPIFNTPYPISQEPVSNMPGPGGGSSGSPYNPIYTKPEVIIVNRRECKKIKEALDSNNFRQEVVNLAGLVNDPVNENGMALYSNGTAITFTPAPELQVPLIGPTPMFTPKYTVISHTHNTGKLSVFSYADLEAIARLLAEDNIDTGTFVATVSTQKGTHYALTISDTQRFKLFFNSKFVNLMGLSQAELPDYKDKNKKNSDLEDKYYGGSNPYIHVNNSNNEMVLKHFLSFLKEADLGVSLFETDATFQEFEQVSLKSDGSIQRKKCN